MLSSRQLNPFTFEASTSVHQYAALHGKSGEDINALLETRPVVMLCMPGLTSNHGCDA